MIRFVSRALVALALVSTTVVAQRGVPIPPQHLTFTPCDASGICDVGETVGWTVGRACPTRTNDILSERVRGGSRWTPTRSGY